jgi:hypothetical protein
VLFPGDQLIADRADVEWALEAKCPRERATPLGELEAAQVRMQVRTSTGKPTSRIRNDATCNAFHDNHETDQI